MKKINKIILASSSKRRQELLRFLFDDFTIKTKEVDETLKTGLTLDEALKDLAVRKSEVLEIEDDCLIISADTVVVFGDKILGKPKDDQQAFEYLKMLSGNVHEVKTAVCLKTINKTDCFVSSAKVYFSDMNDDEIKEYIKTNEPFDKAGAYGIQGYGSKFIEKIEGDYYTIMGLPINALYKHLKFFD